MEQWLFGQNLVEAPVLTDFFIATFWTLWDILILSNIQPVNSVQLKFVFKPKSFVALSQMP